MSTLSSKLFVARLSAFSRSVSTTWEDGRHAAPLRTHQSRVLRLHVYVVSFIPKKKIGAVRSPVSGLGSFGPSTSFCKRSSSCRCSTRCSVRRCRRSRASLKLYGFSVDIKSFANSKSRLPSRRLCLRFAIYTTASRLGFGNLVATLAAAAGKAPVAAGRRAADVAEKAISARKAPTAAVYTKLFSGLKRVRRIWR